MLLVAAAWPSSPALPLVGRVAVLGLAAAAAYLMDDVLAPVTSVVPRGPWRRRAPVVVSGAALLGGAWLGVLLSLRWRHAQPPVIEASAELLVLALTALAGAALLFRIGDPEPGAVAAPAVVLLGLSLMVVEGVARSPIYLTSSAPTAGRVAGWALAGAVAVLVFVVEGRDVASSSRTEPTPFPEVTSDSRAPAAS